MLANAVLYAGQGLTLHPRHPEPAHRPVDPHTTRGTQVCHLVDVIVDHDAVMVPEAFWAVWWSATAPLAALDDLVVVEHWRHACPVHRVGALMYLAWHAHNATPTAAGTPPRRVDMARAL